jgi:putative peptide zinc metalloprotease protein
VDYTAELNTLVSHDTELMHCEDPLLKVEVRVLEARLRELQAQYDARIQQDRVAAKLTLEEIKSVRENLERERKRVRELVVRSPTKGRFIVPNAVDLPGRFVRKGEVIAYILDPSAMTVRVAVPEEVMGLMGHRIEYVRLRPANMIERIVDATIKHATPGGSNKLISPVLGTVGGGQIPIDPRDTSGMSSFQRVFEFELDTSDKSILQQAGMRVHVLFDHGYAPLGMQVYRSLRQLFLGTFHV